LLTELKINIKRLTACIGGKRYLTEINLSNKQCVIIATTPCNSMLTTKHILSYDILIEVRKKSFQDLYEIL